MSKIITVIVALFLFSAGLAFHHHEQEDKTSIEKMIKDAYIDGVHNLGDAQLIRQGFHPEFTMLVFQDGKLLKVSLEQWIERIGEGKNKASDAPLIETTYKIRHIDVAGNSAIAAIDVSKGGKHIFTDYMSLYKFEEGWKIVNKIFYRHTQ